VCQQASKRTTNVKKAKPALCLGLAVALAAAAQQAAAVEATANIGFMSDYIFRGIEQSESAAMGGFDVKHEGFYAGTWAADVSQGLEVDLYAGYNGSIGDFTYGIGATGYYYTDDFDDTYEELNLSVGYKIFSVAAAFGSYDNFDEPSQDYTYVAPRVDYKGFYGLVGIFGNDFDGEYYEAGYGSQFEPIGLDYKLYVVHSTDDLLGDTDGDGEDDDDTSVVFQISKTFKLFP
jgi:uncharacterized protein (TIGR02001 family)